MPRKFSLLTDFIGVPSKGRISPNSIQGEMGTLAEVFKMQTIGLWSKSVDTFGQVRRETKAKTLEHLRTLNVWGRVASLALVALPGQILFHIVTQNEKSTEFLIASAALGLYQLTLGALQNRILNKYEQEKIQQNAVA